MMDMYWVIHSDKRLTLLEAFTEIQNYAISREEYINEHSIPSIHDMKEGNKENGLYTISIPIDAEGHKIKYPSIDIGTNKSEIYIGKMKNFINNIRYRTISIFILYIFFVLLFTR